MNEYLQKQIKNTSSPNKGWYNDVYTEPNSDPINGPDLYTNTIKKYMEELAKQNKPKF
jgi:hypothetical protein